jgi:hypothetical protein
VTEHTTIHVDENVVCAPTVTTKMVIEYDDALLEMNIRLPAYLGNDTMADIRGHLQKVADLVWGKGR